MSGYTLGLHLKKKCDFIITVFLFGGQILVQLRGFSGQAFLKKSKTNKQTKHKQAHVKFLQEMKMYLL